MMAKNIIITPKTEPKCRFKFSSYGKPNRLDHNVVAPVGLQLQNTGWIAVGKRLVDSGTGWAVEQSDRLGCMTFTNRLHKWLHWLGTLMQSDRLHKWLHRLGTSRYLVIFL